MNVAVNYSSFQNAGGAGFGQRLHLVSLPDCALTTPNLPACQVQTPVASQNDQRTHTLSTTLAPTAASSAATKGDAPGTSRRPMLASSAGSTQTMAAVAGASGSNGTFTASSLAPSGSWSVGGDAGSFAWSYPITAPAPGAGDDVAPKVALSYNSGSVDGRIASTNDQSSWVGAGWDYSPGYIERTYRTCADDTTLPTANQTGDTCWAGQIVTMSLGGSSTALVYDDSTHIWHPQNDDGARVELVGAGSGGYQGEYWRITETNGVQYFFGRDILPGGTSATDTHATWTEPVYGAHTGDPCYNSAGFSQSSCVQAWRWNLDFVIDPNSNATSYSYVPETNYYGQNNKTTATTSGDSYTRGGYLAEIDYGLRDEGTPASIYTIAAAGKITFAVAERCLPSGTITCDPSQFTAANASSWPDTPQDQQCTLGAVCNNHAPTFWSTKRLTTITTSYHTTGTSYATANTYTLAQSFPGGGDQEMDLNSITRVATGSDASTITLPAVTFIYQLMANRVSGYNGQPDMLHERLTQITAETGETINIDYEQSGRSPALCTSSTVPTDPSHDNTECFPVYWTPPYNTVPILDYFHKYVVTEVDTYDPDNDPNAISPARDTTYTYLGAPAWHFDDNEVVKPKYRTYGQFRGYSQVQTRTGTPTNASNGVADTYTLSTATYFRGMDGDTLPGGATRPASVTDSLNETITDSNQYADTTREVQTFNGDSTTQLSTTITTPATIATTATRARTGLPALTALIVATAVKRTYTYLASGTPNPRMTQASYIYDSTTGQVIQETDTGTGVNPVCTTTHYADNTTSWIRNQPSEVITSAQTCPSYGTAPTPVVKDIRTYYDNTALNLVGVNGNATEVDTETTTSPSSHWAVTKVDYDTSGRQKSSTVVVDGSANPAVVRTTSITYTPADGGPLTQTMVADPRGAQFTTTSTFDPDTGVTTETVDAAGHVTDGAYDALGRLTSLWKPGQAKTGQASQTFSYQYGPNAPLAVTTKTLVDPGNGATPVYTSAIKIYDGYGTLRQTQSDAVTGNRVIADQFTDSHGWTIQTNNHWVTSGAPSTTIVTAAQSSIDDSTQTAYDGAGRAVKTTEFKGTTATWNSQTIYGGDRVTTVPPTGGVETTSITDVRGNQTELDQWTTAPTITASGVGGSISGGTAARTSYSYDVLNRRTQMTGAADSSSLAATWSTTYDLAGRAITQTDPDTGTTTSAYDDANDLTSTTDANGNTLTYAYDVLGRKTWEYNGTASVANQLASWTYDSVQVGQLTNETRYGPSGNNTVTTANGYDGAGRMLSSTTTVPSNVPGLAGDYTTKQTYTSTGQLATLTPAAGGLLPTETIKYYYNTHGDPTAATGFNAYVSATTYDALDAPTRYTLGVNNQVAWLNTNYDPQTRRVTSQLLSSQSAAIPQLENVAYSYDAAGNPTRTVDTQGGGTGAPQETTCYRYNRLDQLSEAWAATDSCTADPATNGTGGTPSNATVGGAQPFWDSWSFDAAGDRVTQTQHATTGSSSNDTTTTYTNGVGTNPTHGHQLASTSTTGPGTALNPAGPTTSTYDPAGNTTTTTTPAGTSTFTYTTDEHINTVAAPGGTVAYTYDANGNELLRSDPNGTTLYLPGEELTAVTANSTTTVTGTRFYSFGGTVVNERVGRGNPIYLFSDQHGTAQTEVPTTQTGTSTPVRRFFDPYGNAQSATTGGAWSDSHTFLNRPLDATTNLIDIGARSYSAITGRFLTVDPVLEGNSPQQLNGYGYGANNPVTNSDPSGLMLPSGGGNGGGYCTGNGGCNGGSGTSTTPAVGACETDDQCSRNIDSTPSSPAPATSQKIDPRQVLVTINNPNYKPDLCKAYGGGAYLSAICSKTGTFTLAQLQANAADNGPNYCGSLSWLCTITGVNSVLQCVNDPGVRSCGRAVLAIATDVFVVARGVKLITLVSSASESIPDLAPTIAKTFSESSYSKVTATAPRTLYRVYGGTAKELGGYWTDTLPSSSADAVSKLALDPNWGNTATQWVSIEVPTGTSFYEGTAAAQGSLPGGGNQILFSTRVSPDWVTGGGDLP